MVTLSRRCFWLPLVAFVATTAAGGTLNFTLETIAQPQPPAWFSDFQEAGTFDSGFAENPADYIGEARFANSALNFVAGSGNYTNLPAWRLGGDRSKTIVGAPGETVVLTLRGLTAKRHSSITLEGSATTKFVIDVQGRFSLSGFARITLAGDVTSSNVVFDVAGHHAVTLDGNSVLEGTLIAENAMVKLTDRAIVFGAVIARKVLLADASQIIPPNVASE